MGVYVKGMEMPQGCFFCICNKHLDPDTDMCILTRDKFDSTFRVVEHRRYNCPLVPVPPHGRLGDLDALAEEDNRQYNEYRKDNGLDDACHQTIQWMLSGAPTIIPAEEGE